MRGLIVDLFAGGGGASTGIEAALGRSVSVAINHSPVALAVHADNHPETIHLTADIWEVDPKVATRGRPVDLLWASPDCRHFSRAKSGTPRSKGVRSLAHVVVEWARSVRPEVIAVENVVEFTTWGPLDDSGEPIKERAGESFRYWVGQLQLLGYSVDYRVLDASHYGAPTKRKRLFIVAKRDGSTVVWPSPTHGPGRLPYKTAAECIDWSIPCPSIFDRKKPLAQKTLWRLAQGIGRYVLSGDPFIVDGAARLMIQTGYGERQGQRARTLDIQEPLGTIVAGGAKHAVVAAWLAKHYGGVVGQRIDVPTSTITAQDHHALSTATLSADDTGAARVSALLEEHGVPGPHLVNVSGVPHRIVDIGMRMLRPHELLKAQFGRFADTYKLDAAPNETAKIRLVGNSVCPEVAEALILSNVAQRAEVAA